ncbi:MAG: hypothetical protein ABIT07_03910, partial [Ferruginibacter sp.]
MKLLHSTLSVIKNKYFIASAFFILWMLFFDPKDWGLISARINKLKELQRSEKHLSEQINET